ncbi:MAG: helix-turn-helix domain-containing protein [Pseudonocardiaceae bacterium]
MGIRLMIEVLDHAPAELTPPERLLLVALAETARDDTRSCWPGMETLTRRTGLSARRVREVLAELAQRGYEVRVPSGVDKRGMPVFASKGHRTVYRVPPFRQRRPDSAALEGAGSRPLHDAKAAESGAQRRRNPVAKAAESRPPSPQEPSREPSNPPCASRRSAPTQPDRRTTADLNTIRTALANIGSKRTDDDWCRRVVKHAQQNGTARNDLTGFVVACIENEPERFKPLPDYAPQYRPEENR